MVGSNHSGSTGDVLLFRADAKGTLTVKTTSTGSGTTGSTPDSRRLVLALGVAKLVLGGLMLVFGVLALVHDASLSNLGGGIWGGAVVLASGVVGVVAGIRYPTSVHLAGFLALSLLSLAVTNLALVLTVTSLIRDGRRPDIVLLHNDVSVTDLPVVSSSWASLLANSGLLLVAALECFVSLVAGIVCYREVCPCGGHRRLPQAPDTQSKKERLISWLGQQRQILVVPQVHGHRGPVFTSPIPPQLIPAPLSSAPSSLTYGPVTHPPPRGHFRNPLLHNGYRPIVRGMAPNGRRHMDRGRRHRRHEERHRRRRVVEQKETKPEVTEDDVARTYTGLDREIAEEFIAIAMEPGMRQCRTPSTSDHSTPPP